MNSKENVMDGVTIRFFLRCTMLPESVKATELRNEIAELGQRALERVRVADTGGLPGTVQRKRSSKNRMSLFRRLLRTIQKTVKLEPPVDREG